MRNNSEPLDSFTSSRSSVPGSSSAAKPLKTAAAMGGVGFCRVIFGNPGKPTERFFCFLGIENPVDFDDAKKPIESEV